MKTLLPLVLLCLGSTLLAQTTGDISDRWATLNDVQATIAWERLMKVTSGETVNDAQSNLRSKGLSAEGAKALVSFRGRAVAELDRVGRQFHVDVCNKRNQIRKSGNAETVARMVEETIQQENDARRRLLAEADSLLDRPDQERLDTLYSSEYGPRVKIIDTGVAEEVRTGVISVEQVIEAACDISRQTGD